MSIDPVAYRSMNRIERFVARLRGDTRFFWAIGTCRDVPAEGYWLGFFSVWRYTWEPWNGRAGWSVEWNLD